MEEIFTISFIDNLKIIFVGLMLYAIIYAMLKKINIFPSEKIGSLVALLAAIIVSLTGIVSYIISYTLNWFIILFFIIFLLIVLLLFLGVNMADITTTVTKNAKFIVIIFFILFSIIFIKGFFGVNNQFDLENMNDPNYDPYAVDTSPNPNIETTGFFDRFDINFNFDSEMAQVSIFLLVIGMFVMFINKD